MTPTSDVGGRSKVTPVNDCNDCCIRDISSGVEGVLEEDANSFQASKR